MCWPACWPVCWRRGSSVEAACAQSACMDSQGDAAAARLGRRAMLPGDLPMYFSEAFRTTGWESRHEGNAARTVRWPRSTWTGSPTTPVKSGKITRRTAEVMGVVKADAYGHGVSRVVPVLLENGVTRLAVSMLDEALELRRQGVDVPILVLIYRSPPRRGDHRRRNHPDRSQPGPCAGARSGLAMDRGRVHIKIDTGMGRVGFLAGFGGGARHPLIACRILSLKACSRISRPRMNRIPPHSPPVCAFHRGPGGTDAGGVTIPITCLQQPRHSAFSVHAHGHGARGADPVRNDPSPCCGDGTAAARDDPQANVVLCKEIEPGSPVRYGRTWVAPRRSASRPCRSGICGRISASSRAGRPC